MIKKWIIQNKPQTIGIVTGGIAGALYYAFVGCANGTCIISSNIFISVPYGALSGYLLAGIFAKSKPVKE